MKILSTAIFALGVLTLTLSAAGTGDYPFNPLDPLDLVDMVGDFVVNNTSWGGV